MDDLISLAKLINDSVDQIVKSCKTKNAAFPSLDEPFTPESEAFRADEDLSRATNNIIAAAAQLTALVRPAPLSLITFALQFHVPSVLRVALETNVAEIVREAGPGGIHVREIAQKNKQDPNKLARVLRLLATEHIFREISPDVFTNNRLSSLLDTGKSSADLFARPSEKHTGTTGFPAVLSHTPDEPFKSSAFLADALLDPEFSHSHDHTRTAFSKSFNTDLSWVSWMEKPGNEDLLSEFSMAMVAKSSLAPNQILKGLDWKGLPEGSVVVDVGGGIGSLALSIAKENSHLKVILQDLEATIEDAKPFWEQNLPEALKSGQVTLQSHNFFDVQPVKDAAVYYMRDIMHDWADPYCVKILSKLRESATADTKLLLIDIVIEYACKDTSDVINVPGGIAQVAPTPLLPNYGHTNIFNYMCDLQMMIIANGQERTLAHMGQLLQKSGWRLSQVFRAASPTAQILAVPM